MHTHANRPERWSNPACPEAADRECYPPLGLSRLTRHHFKRYRHPFLLYAGWWRWIPHTHTCTCGEAPPPSVVDEQPCTLTLYLAPNSFGPNRSFHVVAAPRLYFAEFALQWASTGVGQVQVDLMLTAGPVLTPQRLTEGRGPNDQYLFCTRRPGAYVFHATATDAQGHTCFATLQVDLPGL